MKKKIKYVKPLIKVWSFKIEDGYHASGMPDSHDHCDHDDRPHDDGHCHDGWGHWGGHHLR